MNEVIDYIVGIDLGSAGLIGGLAKRDPSGATQLLAIKQLPAKSEIRRGVVHNVEVVTSQIKELLALLLASQNLDANVVRVNIGMNGYSLRSVETKSVLPFSGNERLLDSHLDDLRDDAQNSLPEGYEPMDVFPQEFLVDGKPDLNPVGTMPLKVEGRYQTVIGRPFLSKGLDACFEGLNMDYTPILGPIATAEAVLKPEEKKRGVAVFDFGAQTTSLVVFKNNIMRYLAILPMGGEQITKDLQSANLDTQEAEQYKLEQGSALHYADQLGDDEESQLVPTLNEQDKEYNEILVARVEEIVENLYVQLHYAGVELPKLTDGIVITGGGSRLKDLSTLINKKTGLNVRIGMSEKGFSSLPAGVELGPEEALCAGLLLLGQKGCLTPIMPVDPPKALTGSDQKLGGFDLEPQPPEKPTPQPDKRAHDKKNGPVSSLIGKMKKMFEDDDL